jgi:hypothetical protein
MTLLSRLLRSIRRHGVAGTWTRAWEAGGFLVKRARIAEHLEAPFWMLRKPSHARAWVRDRFRPESPIEQGLPWLSWPCIDFLNAYLKPNQKVIEYGGGGSTLFFLKKGCSLVTVESSQEWADSLTAAVANQTGTAGPAWQLRLTLVSGNDDPAIDAYINEADCGGPWDVALVDGWSRSRCILAAKPFVVPGGILIVDNANQRQFHELPRAMNGWTRHVLRGLGPGRSWVTQTDIYVRNE